MTLFAFHTNEKQYSDTLHKQKKKEMHHFMHKYDFEVSTNKPNCPLGDPGA